MARGKTKKTRTKKQRKPRKTRVSYSADAIKDASKRVQLKAKLKKELGDELKKRSKRMGWIARPDTFAHDRRYKNATTVRQAETMLKMLENEAVEKAIKQGLKKHKVPEDVYEHIDKYLNP